MGLVFRKDPEPGGEGQQVTGREEGVPIGSEARVTAAPSSELPSVLRRALGTDTSESSGQRRRRSPQELRKQIRGGQETPPGPGPWPSAGGRSLS